VVVVIEVVSNRKTITTTINTITTTAGTTTKHTIKVITTNYS
jgi:hypothetical protein